MTSPLFFIIVVICCKLRVLRVLVMVLIHYWSLSKAHEAIYTATLVASDS